MFVFQLTLEDVAVVENKQERMLSVVNGSCSVSLINCVMKNK